jgi:exopolysaccharide biosynthesis polyprenyl glycosylphosphotransferase
LCVNRKKRELLIVIALVIADSIAAFASSLTAFLLTLNISALSNEWLLPALKTSLLTIPLRILAFYVFNLYKDPLHRSTFDLFINSVKACTISSLLIAALMCSCKSHYSPGLWGIVAWVASILYVNAWRLAARKLGVSAFGPEMFRLKVLIVGTGKAAEEAAMMVSMDTSINYRLKGFIRTDAGLPAEIQRSRILGKLEDLPFLIKKLSISEVIITDNGITEKEMAGILSLLSWENVQLKAIPDVYGSIIRNAVLYENGAPLLGTTFTSRATPSWYPGFKKVADTVAATLLIIMTAPIALIAALLIKLTAPGPVLYLQKRTGLNGKPFIMYKFRTMRLDAEKPNKPRWACVNDDRVFPVGRFLRRYRIDELPQLVNVLKNEMSIIGPRPERPYFTWKLMKTIPFYSQRLKAKPGLTGWAQVNYQYTDTVSGAKEKLLYDLFYVKNVSLTLDFLIAIKTFRVILTGHGAH